MTYQFPEDFCFGTATASYQIEGGVHEGGRGVSVWDTFSHTPGMTLNGDTGDIADDSYHRYQDDIDLLTDLGVDAYRFSIAMPRIMPENTSHINEEGVDYYSRLVDGLLERGIKPVATLYHWDTPQYLEDGGGLLNRDTAQALADYTYAIVGRLGDRVKFWSTLNEPWCSAFLGYGNGAHAPGLELGGQQTFMAAHHLNLAHGLMLQAIRSVLSSDVRTSVTINPQFVKGDSQAVHRIDVLMNRVFLDPMLKGGYPSEIFDFTKGMCDWSFIRPGDLETIHQPLDVLGLNYYSTNYVKMSDRPQFPQVDVGSAWPGCSDIDFVDKPGERTDMGWLVEPEGISDMLLGMSRNYPDVSLMITENGAAEVDRLEVAPDGTRAVHDPERISYLQRHIDQVGRAISLGADVVGYFLWSLMDNFEWGNGFTKRFGLAYVDYDTLERIPKDSFYWYRDFLKTREI
jgi:beta-glucosidase